MWPGPTPWTCVEQKAPTTNFFDGRLKEANAPLYGVLLSVGERSGFADDCSCRGGGGGEFDQGGLNCGILVGFCFGKLVKRGVSICGRGRKDVKMDVSMLHDGCSLNISRGVDAGWGWDDGMTCLRQGRGEEHIRLSRG